MQWIIVTGDSGGLGSAIVSKILADGQYGVIGISRHENDKVAKAKSVYSNYVHIDYDFLYLTDSPLGL